MGLMKDFDIRIRNGGDDAAGAVNELMAELQRRLLELQASMPRWIPVTERLPEPYTLVLGGFVTMGEWVECLTAWHETHWYKTEPSHWMPLPAPPTDAK